MDTRTAPGCEQEARARRVVIAGGGYAGTSCAVDLARRIRPGDDIEIMMVEPDPCQQALSELDLVAVGPAAQPQFCELWHPTIFRNLPVTVCYNRVASVEPERHLVTIGDGQEVPYWRLVIATGAIASVPPIPGLRDRAITMWSVDDARELQQAVERQFKAAAKVADAEERRRALSFTVIGGGATGVEIVGTLGQMLPKRARDAGLDPADLRMHLVEGRPDILYDLPAEQRSKAIRRLQSLGVDVFTGNLLHEVHDSVATLADGRDVSSAVLVWAGGAKADPHAVEWGLQADNSGRLVADAVLKAAGRDDIYVIGDVAAARNPKTNTMLPMLAQMAIQEGPHTARNVLREARGHSPEPFEPHMRGEFVSVGPSWGVGWMFSLNLTGIPAIVMKRITYVKYWLQVGGIGLAWKRTREMLRMQR